MMFEHVAPLVSITATHSGLHFHLWSPTGTWELCIWIHTNIQKYPPQQLTQGYTSGYAVGPGFKTSIDSEFLSYSVIFYGLK